MTTGAYEPMFSDGTLPLPTGLFGTDMNSRFSPEQQRVEAAKMLEMMKTTPSFDLGRLTLMHTPVPLLVQIPDMNKVRMIHGVAPFLGHPLAEPSTIEGTLLGIDGDIDEHGEIPRVIRLPANLFVTKTITVPTQTAFETKITTKPRDAGTPWFRATQLSETDKTTTDLALTIPFPPYLAYDALNEDVPAHIIWERIRQLELPTEPPSQLFQEIKTFLSATHTRYIDSAMCVTLPTNTFTQRMTPDMKTWVKDRIRHVYKLHTTPNMTNPQQGPAPPGATTQPDIVQALLQTLLQHQQHQTQQGDHTPATGQPQQASGVTESTCEVMKKYGLCPSDFSRFLNMCGLADGQEELLPPWLAHSAEKGLSKDGKYAVVREACTDLIFDDNPIPLITKTRVSDALAAISKTIELAGLTSPLYRAPKSYTLPIERCIEGMRREDPPAIPQLAVPVTVPNKMARAGYASTSTLLQAVGDLAIIAFYFLLRVGEYTKPRFVTINGRQLRATRTVQFHVKDVGFFKNGRILPRRSPLSSLITADQCILKITNQKNGRMGETITHETVTHLQHGPVTAAAQRVFHILNNGGTEDSLLCDYLTDDGIWKAITPTDMRTTLRTTVQHLKLHECGIDPDLVGVHSLRAGGAMALKLQGVEDTTIKKQG